MNRRYHGAIVKIGYEDEAKHAQESAETQRPPHRLRNVEHHRPRQATVAAADALYAHVQFSHVKPSHAQPGTLPAPTAPALHLSSTILRKASCSATEEEYPEYFSNYLWLFCTQMPVLRRRDLL